MASYKSKSKSTCKRLVKELDVYGVPVSLTFKSDPQIKSVVGGTATILARMLTVAYLVYQCLGVF